MERVLAIDIGGTKMAAAIVDRDGTVTNRQRCSTPMPATADQLFSVVCDTIEPLGPFDQFVGCGIGCGGPMTRGGVLVSPLNIPGWRDFPLAERIAEHTGLEAWVDNDAKALALAEGWIGAAVGQRDFVAMVVSTGVGGGIVCDGQLLDGAAGNAGHIGQVVVEPDGHQPPRQIRGVLEAEASGTSLEHITGHPAKESSTAVITRTGRLVGQAVGSVANLLDLRLAVASGSVALGFGEPFFVAAQAEINRICQLDYSRGVRIVPSALGDEGPLVGAGAVAWRALGHRVGLIEPRR